jgi:hypothetical protein
MFDGAAASSPLSGVLYRAFTLYMNLYIWQMDIGSMIKTFSHSQLTYGVVPTFSYHQMSNNITNMFILLLISNPFGHTILKQP